MTDNEFSDVVIFARRYINEAASKVQYDEFAKFWKREKITNLSAFRMNTGGGEWVIAVIDATGRAGEFAWAGEPYELSQTQVDALAERMQDGRFSVHYPPAMRPSLQPDGTWAMPRPQG